MANFPAFASYPVPTIVQLSKANTARDGSGAVVYASVNAPNGYRVDQIIYQAVTNNAAGTLRRFVAGVLANEIPTTATTPSGTVAAAQYTETFINPPLILSPGTPLGFCTNNAEPWSVVILAAAL